MSQLFPKSAKRKTGNPLLSWWIWVSIAIASIAVIPWLIGPSCPDKIVIATGSENGAYFAFANQYKDELAKNGIELQIVQTAGSVENHQMLNNGDVDIAFIQGGIDHGQDTGHLRSLASLYLEPLWVFHRSDVKIGDLSDLKNKRVAIGNQGSGTRDLAVKLMRENNVDDQTRSYDEQATAQWDLTNAGRTEFVEIGGSEAQQALLNNKIDAMFAVVSAESDLVKCMIADPRVATLDMARADAYCTKYRYLSKAILPEGFFDFESNIPAKSIQLVAPSANLVATKDLHPALVPLLLDMTKSFHHAGGVFEKPGDFPNENLVDFKLNRNSQRYFANGAPFFYRILPFQLAAWLDQVKLLIFPMVTLLLPLIKIAPPVYRWSIRVKIYRWYRILRDIDIRLASELEEFDFDQEIDRLELLGNELANVSVPLSYMEEYYNLKLHVAHVRNQLERQSRTRFAKYSSAA